MDRCVGEGVFVRHCECVTAFFGFWLPRFVCVCGFVNVCTRRCVCVCVICTIYEVDPYAAMRWQVYSAQSAVASLRL